MDHGADAGCGIADEPIFNAQPESVRRSRVIAMGETPIKAGAPGQER